MEPKAEYYWSLLESTQQRCYPEFVRQLSKQIGGEQNEGRAAVITLHDGAMPREQIFTESSDLHEYFMDSSFTPSTDAPIRRRVFVLEGLPKRFIQTLGSNLQVPPSFFAAHWVHPGNFVGSLLNHTPRSYNHQSRFTLTFPKLHLVQIQEKPGDDADPVYVMRSSITRQLTRNTLFAEYEDPFWSLEKASFWSVRKEESWDALLLVDPPLGNFVMWKNDHRPRRVVHYDQENANSLGFARDGADQDGSWYPPFPTDDSGRTPNMRSMFDDIVSLYSTWQHQSTADPTVSTDICRQLILSAWTARLRVIESEVVRKHSRMTTGQGSSPFSPRTWLDRSWTQPWTEREYGGLVRAKSALQSMETMLLQSMDALGMSGQDHIGENWEAEAWKSLWNALQSLKARVDLMSQAYTQAVSVRESIIANKQAQQVGYLTSLATFFIPVSFLAAVFSMGGDYAAGQRHFYVFWAISLPFMIITPCIYIFGDRLLRVLQQFLGWWKREKQATNPV